MGPAGRGPEVILEIDTDSTFFGNGEDPSSLRDYTSELANCGHEYGAQLLDHIADQWEAALPKPRMAEPAWGERVIAHADHLGEERNWEESRGAAALEAVRNSWAPAALQRARL